MGQLDIGFFEEKEGQKSMTRLLTFVLVISGVLIALGTVVSTIMGQEIDAVSNMSFSMALIGSGLTGKVIQKFGEK